MGLDSREEEAEYRSVWSSDFLLALLSMFSDYFGIGVVTPLLPFWLRKYGYPVSWVSALIATQYAAIIIGMPIFGWISHKAGVKPTLAVVMVLDVAFFGAAGFATDIVALAALRFGAGLCAPQGLSIAWIALTSDAASLPFRMGAVAASIHGGILLGAVIGGLMGPGLWRVACLISAAPCLIVAVCLLLQRLGMIDDGQQRRRRQQQQQQQQHMELGKEMPSLEAAPDPEKATALPSKRTRDDRLEPLATANALTMVANGIVILATLASWPVALVRDYGFNSAQVALTIAPGSFGQLFIHFFILKRLLRLDLTPWELSAALSTGTAVLYGLGALAVALADSPWPLLVVNILGFWLTSLNQGTHNFISAQLSEMSTQPAAFVGVVRGAFQLGSGVGPIILVAIYINVGLPGAMLTTSVLLFVSAACSYCGHQCAQRDGPSTDPTAAPTTASSDLLLPSPGAKAPGADTRDAEKKTATS